MDLYQNIRKRREEIGMTQDELAEILGYKTRSTIARIESGENDLNQTKIKAFADALGVSVQYLMGLTTDGVTNRYVIDFKERALLRTFRKLTDVGKEKVIDYSKDLSLNPVYAQQEEPTRQQMITWLNDNIRTAALGGANYEKMSDEDLTEFYQTWKEKLE